MALTAAHCIEGYEDGRDPGMTVRLSDGELYRISEFRANDCFEFGWNFWLTYTHDIAIMILDRPIPNAVEGRHYVKTWDVETMGSEVGKQFIVAGWGASGEIRDDGDESHQQSEVFHRGYNVFHSVRNDMLLYYMDRPEDGGLELEAQGYYGDSGSGALIERDGQLHIAGVA